MKTRVKICGITRAADLDAAVSAGADAIGLVFHPASPRHLSLAQAAELARQLPPFVTCVALCVDADAEWVRQMIAAVRPDLLQFHGQEPPEFCVAFGRPYLKALRVRPGVDLLQYAILYGTARGLLLDAYVPGKPGGTGRRFDWSLIPADLPLPVVLSGGLMPANVAAAVRQVRPAAVDVSSGVEATPGIKDAAKIQAFIQEVRNADV